MAMSAAAPAAQLNALPVNDRLGVLGAGCQYLNIQKTLDQTVSNSIVLANDNELACRVPYTPIGGAIALRMVLQLQIANAANNIRWQLAPDEGLLWDTNASRYFATYFLNGTAPQIDNALQNVSLTNNGGATNAWTQLVIEGSFRVVQPGLVRFAFAQQVAAANNTTVLRGSFMALTLFTPSLR